MSSADRNSEAGMDLVDALFGLLQEIREGKMRPEHIKWLTLLTPESRDELVRKAPMPTSCLRPVRRINVKGTAREFAAKDHLAEARIGQLGEGFRELFLKFAERDVEDAIIAVHEVLHDCPEMSVYSELGDKAETRLVYLFNLLESPTCNTDGILLVNDGLINTFYITAARGVLCIVFLLWDLGSRSWIIDARPMSLPSNASAGGHVFSLG